MFYNMVRYPTKEFTVFKCNFLTIWQLLTWLYYQWCLQISSLFKDCQIWKLVQDFSFESLLTIHWSRTKFGLDSWVVLQHLNTSTKSWNHNHKTTPHHKPKPSPSFSQLLHNQTRPNSVCNLVSTKLEDSCKKTGSPDPQLWIQ